MANIKSQKKRVITNEKSRLRNRSVRAELKTATRRVREAVEAGDAPAAYAAALKACRLLDKAVTKGIIHKNQAANRKSGVMRLANSIVTDEVRAAYVKPEKRANKPGTKKVDARNARKEAMAAASAEKAIRREAQKKAEAEAAKRKAEAATEEEAE